MKNKLKPYNIDIANEVYHLLFRKEESPRKIGIDPSVEETDKIILEIMMEGGLDTMEVKKDGSIKYINHSGAMSILAYPNPLSIKCRRIIKLVDKKYFRQTQALETVTSERQNISGLPREGHARITIFDNSGVFSYEDTIISMSTNSNTKEILFLCGILLHEIITLVTDKQKPSNK